MKTPPAVRIFIQSILRALAVLLAALAFTLFPTHLQAKEWWVDGSVQVSGSGTQASPYKTITQAVNASGTCDIITVKSGTYSEFLTLKGGTPANPYTLRSDTNARVILTGFSPLPTQANWSVYSSGSSGTVYTGTANWAARDIFIGNLKQRIARIPAVGQPWAVVQSRTNNTLTLTSSLGITIDSSNIGSCFAYVWGKAGQATTAYPVSSIDGAVIALTGTAAISANDTLVVANHPSFCQATGDWAYTVLSASTTRLYYQTSNISDLDTLQSRKIGRPIVISSKSNVLVDGLEISGGGQPGIHVTSSTNVTIQNCLVHHNSMDTAAYGGAGILSDSCNNVIVQNCIVCCNEYGISSSRTNAGITGTSSGITIKQCEIAFNEADGIDIVGTASYNNPTNSLVQQCYVHNMISLTHPDDLQIYDDVSNLTIDSCYLALAGQNIMAEENDGITISNNVFMASMARSIIVGHGNSFDWAFRNNTFALPVGQSPIGMDVSGGGAPDLTARNDLYFQAKVTYTTGTTPLPVIDMDYSVLWCGTGSTAYIAARSSPWKDYLDVGPGTALYADMGQEYHSYHVDPALRNVPLRSSLAMPPSTLTRLYLQYNSVAGTTGFNVNDYVELNGDGIPRKITAKDSTSITIDTPLSDYVFPRGWHVLNWGPSPSLDGNGHFNLIDTRLPVGSPYLTAGDTGGPIGSTIDTTAYVQGDLDGDGLRDIPALPDEVKASWITYGSYPYYGIGGNYVAPPVINSLLTATGTNGSSFSYQITTAGTNTTSYNASSLPSGLSINAMTGQITGTPLVTGTVSFTITASNFGGTTLATVVLTLLPPPPGITSSLTVTGTNGAAFSYQITATNSPTSYGATNLPSGLSVNTATGVISGTPTVTGTFTPSISASNAGGTGQATMMLTILPAPPVITSALSATGTSGSAFSYQITASNSPTNFGATNLPSGLNVDTATGVISGTPTATGTFSPTISATNAGGTGSATLTLTIQSGVPVIVSALTATGTASSMFSYSITATNNPTSYSASGLPSGLSVNTATGVISGTLTATGTFSCPISAINASGTGSATLVVTGTGHIAYEGFDYPTTTNISTSPDSPSDIAMTGTWSGANDVVAGLSYTGMTCIGNAIQFSSSVTSARSFDMSAMPAGYTVVDGIDGVTRLGKAGTTLWFRFLIRADAADSNGTLVASMNLCGSNSGGYCKMSIGDTGTNGNWNVSKGTTVGASSVPIVTGSTVLLVVRVQFVSGTNNDQVDLFVNPPSGPNPPGTPDATLRNLDIGYFDRIEFKGNRLSTGDEFSMATDWSQL